MDGEAASAGDTLQGTTVDSVGSDKEGAPSHGLDLGRSLIDVFGAARRRYDICTGLS